MNAVCLTDTLLPISVYILFSQLNSRTTATTCDARSMALVVVVVAEARNKRLEKCSCSALDIIM